MRGRPWIAAALVAGFLVLVALACSDDGTPEVRQSRGLMQPRGFPGCTTYVAADVPVVVSDTTGWGESIITIGDYAVITEMTATLSIDWTGSTPLEGQTTAELYDPDSDTVFLWFDQDTEGDIVDAQFSAAGINTIDTGSTPYTALWQTGYGDPLWLNSITNGDWRLSVGDIVTLDGAYATITKFQLEICGTLIAEGVYLFDTGTNDWSPTCGEAFALGKPTVAAPGTLYTSNSAYGRTVWMQTLLCNLTNADLAVTLAGDASASKAFAGGATPLPGSGAPVAYVDAYYWDSVDAGGSEGVGDNDGILTSGAECTPDAVLWHRAVTFSESYTVKPWHVADGNDYNSYTNECGAASGDATYCANFDAVCDLDITYESGPTYTPTPTATPNATQTAAASQTAVAQTATAAAATATVAAQTAVAKTQTAIAALWTPTRTPGPTRATATHTVSPTPWTGITCPTAVVTVDANLADWAAIPATPMPLSAANAAYIWPAATPSVADLSGLFKCAHSADTLFLSGVITDSVLYQDSAPVDDDAAQIALDALGDGFLRLRGDDHELTITQDGRLRDLATLPITATVATTLTVAGWQFEIGIPKSVLELPSLSRRLIGLVFGLIDDDDGGQLDQQIIAPTRTVLLQ